MEPEFWHSRWRENLTAFHRSEVHPYLREFAHRLPPASAGEVFLPLCGKSLDLGWLAGRGYGVLGVELSPIAVRAFFEEHDLAFHETPAGAFRRFEGGGVTLLCGDFFALDAAQLAGVGAVYDRAALVALPPPQRSRYARHLLRCLPAAAPLLVVTFEYAQHEMDGPPFSVGESELRELFGARGRIEALAAREMLHEEPRFRERGMTRLEEKAYLIGGGG